MSSRFKDELLSMARAALAAVEPRALVREALADERGLDEAPSLLALGKAAAPMALGAADALPGGFAQALAILPPRAMDPDPAGHARALAARGIRLLRGAHPVPDAASVAAGRAALELAREARGPLVVLLSGGGSALAVAPRPGVELEALARTHRALLESGADIRAVNAERGRMDALKHGGLAVAAAGASRIVGLALSDVVGSPPESIASGPLTPGAGMRIVGDGPRAARAACAEAERLGARARAVDTAWAGEAAAFGGQVAREALAERARVREAHPGRPRALVWAGESTVKLAPGAPRGRGGPNQEAALAAAIAFCRAGAQARGIGTLFFGTDGVDGPTDAAGAFADASTARGADRRDDGSRAAEALARHDSTRFLDARGCIWRPGPTGTNVADLAFAWVGVQKE